MSGNGLNLGLRYFVLQKTHSKETRNGTPKSYFDFLLFARYFDIFGLKRREGFGRNKSASILLNIIPSEKFLSAIGVSLYFFLSL